MKKSLAILFTALMCGCSVPNYELSFYTTEPTVRLYYTSIPVIGFMAVHPWFITHENGKWNRWEVWHISGLHNTGSHLYKNLFALDKNNGWGDPWIEKEWTGENAIKLINIIKRSLYSYPYRNEYWPWPGPNSNTFISWVLKEAKLEISYPFRALGSGY